MKNRPVLGLVDYGMGNLNSVSKALELAGAKVKSVERVSEMRNCDGIVLPGVGAFSTAIRNLKKKELFVPVKNWIRERKYFLGICLGYQMLFEKSEETLGGREKGLGIFKGTVRRFPKKSALKVPHMGWNQISVAGKSDGIFKQIPDGSYFYFVHSYFPDPSEKSLVASLTRYGKNFVSSISRDNLFACQFHPEKSGDAGLRLLRNFVSSVGEPRC